MDELVKHRNLINYVKARGLGWFGHINGMPETSTATTVHKKKPFKGRPVGKPKSRWQDDVRNNLKKVRLIKWAEQFQDRFKWKDSVE